MRLSILPLLMIKVFSTLSLAGDRGERRERLGQVPNSTLERAMSVPERLIMDTTVVEAEPWTT